MNALPRRGPARRAAVASPGAAAPRATIGASRAAGDDPDPSDGEGGPLEPGGPARTAAALADAIVEGRTVREALIVSSETYADAVPTSGVAATRALPRLYARSSDVPKVTCSWLRHV